MVMPWLTCCKRLANRLQLWDKKCFAVIHSRSRNERMSYQVLWNRCIKFIGQMAKSVNPCQLLWKCEIGFSLRSRGFAMTTNAHWILLPTRWTKFHTTPMVLSYLVFCFKGGGQWQFVQFHPWFVASKRPHRWALMIDINCMWAEFWSCVNFHRFEGGQHSIIMQEGRECTAWVFTSDFQGESYTLAPRISVENRTVVLAPYEFIDCKPSDCKQPKLWFASMIS